MAQKEIAVNGAEVVEDLATQSAGITADFSITTTPSDKWEQDGNGVYFGTLTIAITNAKEGTYEQSAPATGTLDGTAQYADEQNEPVVLKGDGGSATVTVQNTASPFDSKQISVGYEIDNTGQNDKMLAE
jgi:hypothetical protein